MAGEDVVVPRQGRQLPQGSHLGVRVAAGEVRPAAGASEEGVAAEEELAALQRHAAGGVAGGGVDPDGDVAHRQDVPLVIAHGVRHRGEEALHAGLLHGGVPLIEVDGDVRAGGPDACDAAHVVVMAVGQEDGADVAAVLPGGLQDDVGVGAGVDDGAELALHVAEEVAVGLQLPHRQSENFHIIPLSAPPGGGTASAIL